MAHYWFISPKYRQGCQLALLTFLLAFVVILLGAYTRLTDAGLSCPDWPNCYGYLTAPHTEAQLQAAANQYPLTPVNTKKAWTEMTHRYFAGTEGLLILCLAFSILFTRKAKDCKAITIAVALIGLLGVQVMLGMLTVTEKLKPFIVLSHLLTGLSLLVLLWWAYLDLHLRDDSLFRLSVKAKPHILSLWIGFMVIAIQITLGGLVSTHYAGLACTDFPYCNTQLLPTLQWSNFGSDLITIHMLHRLGALATTIYLSGLALFLLNKPALRNLAITLLTLLCIQVTLGILNIIWLRPVWLALLHHGTAILLLLTIVTALIKASLMTGKRHDFQTT